MNEVSKVFQDSRFDISTFIFVLLAVLVFAGVIFFKYFLTKFLEKRKLANAKKSIKNEIVGSGYEFNFIEKKVLFDIIDEFKRSDIMANQIPVSVLEHYSEYFFSNLPRLRITKKEAQKLRDLHFPILSGAEVELEIFYENKLYLFESKVISVSNEYIVVNYMRSNELIIKEGMSVLLNYNINKKFVSGECKIVDIVEDNKIYLSYPKKFVLSNERRYTRINVNNIRGTISGEGIEKFFDINICDISKEGIKIKINTKLRKKTIYKISFSTIIADFEIKLDNIPCVVSKSYLLDTGGREFGMLFYYPPMDQKLKLNEYIRLLSSNVKVN